MRGSIRSSSDRSAPVYFRNVSRSQVSTVTSKLAAANTFGVASARYTPPPRDGG